MNDTGKQGLDLYTTLIEAGEPLAPDELFERSGLRAEEQPESVETFYQALDANVREGLIDVTRQDQPDASFIQLRAAALKGSESAEVAQVAASPITLWDM